MEKQPIYQTANVLIFQRFESDDDIPKEKKIAFHDQYNKPYILGFRRIFTITGNVNKYLKTRVYDYEKEFKKVINILKTSDDFSVFNKDYVNCILIDSIANIDEIVEYSDTSDDDLFMVYKEEGIHNKYAKISRDEILNDNNSCYANLIVKRFQKAFEKAGIYKKNTSLN